MSKQNSAERGTYLDAVRNLSAEQIAAIESDSIVRPDDSAHTAYCKRCYQALQTAKARRFEEA